MKIAIFHQFMDNMGGAEILSLILARELGADVYTTNLNKEKMVKMGFEDLLKRHKIHSIGRVPKNAPFKHQFSSLRFRFLNLKDKYDFFIISGDWAVSGAVRNKPNLLYVHSPPRELFDLRKYVRKNLISWWKRPLFDVWVFFNRLFLKNNLSHVKKIVCNSKNTQGRLKKFLGKEAKIIYPPVECAKYSCKKSKGYWLSVNRLLNHKRVDIQMKAFARLSSERLVIVGSYEEGADHFESYRKYIQKIKPENVEIISWVNDSELKKLYSECKGFITTSLDEDFGMSAIEAMAAGKSVIAPNEGGYKESIVDGKTGTLIDSINDDKLAGAIEKMSKELKINHGKYSISCMERAKNFDVKKFINQIKGEIELDG